MRRLSHQMGGDMKTMLRDAFDRWKGALIDQDKQTTRAGRHRAHARVTSMEDLIAETPADNIEGVGIKLALYIYMSGVDPETADSIGSNNSMTKMAPEAGLLGLKRTFGTAGRGQFPSANG